MHAVDSITRQSPVASRDHAGRTAPPYPLRAFSRWQRGATLALAAFLAAGAGGTAPVRAEIAVEGARVTVEQLVLRALVKELDAWLDAHTDLPRAEHPPQSVVLVDSGAEVPFGHTAHADYTIRAVYEEDESRIYLVRPWFGDTAKDRSILLHELVHHRQVSAQHWYCSQAMEWDAYRIQEDYMLQHGESWDLNWAWVALVSSCTTGDHHPG